jgi:lysophospholipase L1-like esterase
MSEEESVRRQPVLLLLALLLLAGCGGAKSPVTTPARYVALGDSYTAAPEVPTQTGPAICMRSDHNYPSLVAAELHISAFTDRSCGGATTQDMTTSQAPDVGPQFDALTRKTDLVTVGIGGNDLNAFGTLIGYCVQLATSAPQGAPCTAAARKKPGQLRRALATIEHNVAAVLKGVRKRSPKATVIAVGYPQLVPAKGTCPQLLPLAKGDYPLGRQFNKDLDDAVRAAAHAAGVIFVDPWKVSAGHDICSDDPWINGLQNAAGKAAPFHPFAAEQQAVARLVVEAVRREGGVKPSA